MPERRINVSSARSRAMRTTVAALVTLLLATAIIGTPAAARETKLTRQIVATRTNQLFYEGRMRAADRAVKKLGRQITSMSKKQKRTSRWLGRMETRRDEARRDFEISRARLAGERLPRSASLRNAVDTLKTTIADVVESAIPDAAVVPDVPDHDLGQPAAASLLDGVARPSVAVALAEIAELQRLSDVKHKRMRMLERQTSRIERRHRTRIRNINLAKRVRRAAVSRREAAEGALAHEILAMSDLAFTRANRKTDVRPGRNKPFTWPTRGRISQTYGCTGFHLNPSRGSCRHFHDGVDIVGGRGTPIRAMAVGVVSYIGWNPWDTGRRAFIIVLAHPGGYETLYAHLQWKRKVFVGQMVRKGDVIGYMGNTGHSSGTHLHLEMRRGRTTLNPLAYL